MQHEAEYLKYGNVTPQIMKNEDKIKKLRTRRGHLEGRDGGAARMNLALSEKDLEGVEEACNGCNAGPYQAGD
jgi:hypothetical protein